MSERANRMNTVLVIILIVGPIVAGGMLSGFVFEVMHSHWLNRREK